MFKRIVAPLLAVLAIGGLVAACGDDDEGTVGGDATTTTAPEEARASDAEVAAGLRTIDGIAGDIAAAVEKGDDAAAKDLEEQIEPAWQKVEGTVKANDEDAYLAFEDAFAAIGLAIDDMDSSKASQVASDVSAAVASYLEAHPA